MDAAVTVTFALADWLRKGLESGQFAQWGGTIREAATGRIVALLREAGTQITQVPKQLQLAQGVLCVGSAASVLNLGISVAGFALLNQRVGELEQRLKDAQELLNKINRKIEIGYYANFKAALDLAANAFTMSRVENRERSALQAIDRLLAAQHVYLDYTKAEISQKSQVADEYLLTLTLAYIAEARCHLELEEKVTAYRRLKEGTAIIREQMRQYIGILLTSNPAAYLQPQFKEKIDLRRLTRIYQWLDPSLDENAVFEILRDDIPRLIQEPNKWVESLPPAILTRAEVAGGWFGPNQGDLKKEADNRLPLTIEAMESMIETNRRFEAYQAEIQVFAQLKMTFQEWRELMPSRIDIRANNANFMYVIPPRTVEVLL